MRVEMINDENIDIFINSYNFKDIPIYSKESLLEFIKEYLLIINNRYKLNLSGFYKIKSYFNKNVGLFLNVIKIDDNEFSNEADFRIMLFQNEKFLLEIDDYDYIKNIDNKIFYKNKFYVDIEDVTNLDRLIDLGRIIVGDEAKNIISFGKRIK